MLLWMTNFYRSVNRTICRGKTRWNTWLTRVVFCVHVTSSFRAHLLMGFVEVFNVTKPLWCWLSTVLGQWRRFITCAVHYPLIPTNEYTAVFSNSESLRSYKVKQFRFVFSVISRSDKMVHLQHWAVEIFLTLVWRKLCFAKALFTHIQTEFPIINGHI